MRRASIVIATALTLATAGAVGWSQDPDGSAGTGGVRTVDVQALSRAAGGDVSATIANLQAHLRAQPKDARGWATLGHAYVEHARLTGDPSYYGKAEGVLNRSLRVAPTGNDLAVAGQAALAAARHEFARALRLADQALRTNPYQSTALAVRVDALTELGRYRDQLSALAVADRRRPGVPVLTRYAYAYELRGDLDRARQLLRQALTPTTRPVDRVYVLTTLADLDRRAGDLATAEHHLRTALAVDPDHVPAWAGRARLAVARGRLDVAEHWWRRTVMRLPLPEYVVELGELYLATGRPRAAQQQFAVVEATQRLLNDGGVRTDLEVALFEADHGQPEVAVRAARSELARRSSVHVADALGWALHSAGHSGQALSHARDATRLGTVDARLWLHRGLIEVATGRPGDGRRSLRHGLRVDPGVSPWLADQARAALAGLADAS